MGYEQLGSSLLLGASHRALSDLVKSATVLRQDPEEPWLQAGLAGGASVARSPLAKADRSL